MNNGFEILATVGLLVVSGVLLLMMSPMAAVLTLAVGLYTIYSGESE